MTILDAVLRVGAAIMKPRGTPPTPRKLGK
jgi:hypothetical protein